MTQKSYTPEDEEFVRFVRTTHTIAQTSLLSGLSESTVKRILAKRPVEDRYRTRPDEKLSSHPDEISELKSMIEKQNKTIARLMEMVRPSNNEYSEEPKVTKLVLGKRT